MSGKNKRTPRTASAALERPKKQMTKTCELCGRDGVATTVHHLTPRECGGALLPTADLCIPCHKQIHALFTNEQLTDGLNTLQALRANEDMAGFLKWIVKQPPGALPRIRKSNRLRGR